MTRALLRASQKVLGALNSRLARERPIPLLRRRIYLDTLIRPFAIALAALALHLALSSCSPSQSSGSKTTVSTAVEVTIAAGQISTLEIETGALAGTEIEIAADVLSPGSAIDARVTNQPSEFGSNTNVSSGSAPLVITAVGPGGQTITELSQPMTIQIPISNTSLSLKVEASDANLCTFLKTPSGALWVWRNSSLEVRGRFVRFSSTRLGVFQLVYCGDETLDGFNEISDDPGTSTTETPRAKIIIPAGYDLGQISYCGGIYRSIGSDFPTSESQALGAFSAVSALLAAEQSLSVTITDTAGLATLDDEDELHFVLSFVQAGQTCSLTSSPKSLGSTTYAFKRTAAELRSAEGLTGVLGVDYPLSSQALKIGPSGYSGGATSTGCLGTESHGDGLTRGGLSFQSISIDSGLINGESDFTFTYPTGNSSQTLKVYLNSSNCLFDEETASVASGQPYFASFKDFVSVNDDSLYLTPASFSFEDFIAGINRICVRAYPVDIDPANLSAQESYDERVSQFLMAIGSATTYQMYLPYNSTEAYSMVLRPHLDGACPSSASTLLGDKALNVGLSPSIVFEYP